MSFSGINQSPPQAPNCPPHVLTLTKPDCGLTYGALRVKHSLICASLLEYPPLLDIFIILVLLLAIFKNLLHKKVNLQTCN